MKRLFFLLIFLTAPFLSSARSELLLDLEGGKVQELDRLLEDSKKGTEPAQTQYYLALKDLYAGDLENAQSRLIGISSAAYTYTDWLKNYLQEVVLIRSQMEEASSEHFVLRAKADELFLAEYALPALENAYEQIGKDLGVFPKEKISVEIYAEESNFSSASTLSKETLDRSGAIGICKFRRLMILSPRQMAIGYRWLDTLAHELTHYLVNAASGGKCPLWLHEGIAKYLETRWRLEHPVYLTSGNRTLLARAAQEGSLVPFARMAPSMVYLKDQTEIGLAFSQVSHAIDYAVQDHHVSLHNLLLKFDSETADAAFHNAFGMSVGEFEVQWKKFLVAQNLTQSEGAMPDRIRLGKRVDEVEEFVSTNLRGHIRLGDRFRQRNNPEMAIIEYQKALAKEPSNPVALTKSARAYMLLGRSEMAATRLQTCIKDNPGYPAAFLLLCDLWSQRGLWEESLKLALEANAINPFDPYVHKKLSRIYKELGKSKASESEAKIFDELQSQ